MSLSFAGQQALASWTHCAKQRPSWETWYLAPWSASPKLSPSSWPPPCWCVEDSWGCACLTHEPRSWCNGKKPSILYFLLLPWVNSPYWLKAPEGWSNTRTLTCCDDNVDAYRLIPSVWFCRVWFLFFFFFHALLSFLTAMLLPSRNQNFLSVLWVEPSWDPPQCKVQKLRRGLDCSKKQSCS